LVERIRSSPQWQRAAQWGQARPGHPEGTVGRHVEEQVLPFINRHYRDLPDYWSLVALAYLHDIAKPLVYFHHGKVRGEPHSVFSARVAEQLEAPSRLIRVITLNDRAFSHWSKLIDKHGVWTAARWTGERRDAFRKEFDPANVDLELLVRFHRADNAYRRNLALDESIDSVLWFENRLVEEGLLESLPPEGQNERLEWI
jgi:hypothetical protein